jgi:hypothetical protein
MRRRGAPRKGRLMRLRMVTGCSLSRLLACVVPAMAQQRSLTCAQREQQIKSAQDEVARLSAEAVAQKTKCTPPGAARNADACGAYGAALIRQRERQRHLKELTDDPAWHRCPAFAGGTRYTPASRTTTPVENTGPGSARTPGQGPSGNGPDASGSGANPSGTGAGSSAGGPSGGTDRSGSGGGSGLPGGSSGRGSPNKQIAGSGSPDTPQSQHKGGGRAGGRKGVTGVTRTGSVRGSGYPNSRGPRISRPNSFQSRGSHMGHSRSGHAGYGGRGRQHRHRR